MITGAARGNVGGGNGRDQGGAEGLRRRSAFSMQEKRPSQGGISWKGRPRRTHPPLLVLGEGGTSRKVGNQRRNQNMVEKREVINEDQGKTKCLSETSFTSLEGKNKNRIHGSPGGSPPGHLPISKNSGPLSLEIPPQRILTEICPTKAGY